MKSPYDPSMDRMHPGQQEPEEPQGQEHAPETAEDQVDEAALRGAGRPRSEPESGDGHRRRWPWRWNSGHPGEDSDFASKVFGIVGAVLAVPMLVLVGLTLDASRSSVLFAERQWEIARTGLFASQRPWVLVLDPRLVRLSVDGVEAEGVIRIAWRSSGASPAIGARASGYVLRPSEFPRTPLDVGEFCERRASGTGTPVPQATVPGSKGIVQVRAARPAPDLFGHDPAVGATDPLGTMPGSGGRGELGFVVCFSYDFQLAGKYYTSGVLFSGSPEGPAFRSLRPSFAEGVVGTGLHFDARSFRSSARDLLVFAD